MRTRDVVALVIGVLTAIAAFQAVYPSPLWGLDVLVGVGVNVGLTYLIAWIADAARGNQKASTSNPSNRWSPPKNEESPLATRRSAEMKGESRMTSENRGWDTIEPRLGTQHVGRLPKFSDAEIYASENRLSLHEAAMGSVAKGAKELQRIASSEAVTWVFADSHRPFIVAVGNRTIHEFGKFSMFTRSEHSGIEVRYTRGRFGEISLRIGSIVLRNLVPQENAERFVNQLNLKEDSTSSDEEETEVLYKLDEDAQKRVTFLEQQLSAAGIPFDWEHGELVVSKKHESLVDQIIDELDDFSPNDSPQSTVSKVEDEEDVDDIEQRLLRLKKLKDQGLISDSDMSERAREILKEI